MKKLLILLFSILISLNSYAGIGDIYFCEEKEINIADYKAQFILNWNENSMTGSNALKEGSVDTSDTVPFLIHKNNYFVTIKPYREGQIIETFDGETYTSHYVKDSWTFISEYSCEKFKVQPKKD